jgi:hypothetical protein
MSSVSRAGIALGVVAFLFWPLALVLLVVIGQQSCQSASDVGATTAAGGPPTIVGDSITDMSRAALLDKFPAAPIVAKGGMTWQWGIDHLPKPSHSTLAFLMGTNAQKRGTPQVTEADLRALVTAASGVKNLILMTNRMPATPLYSYQVANNQLFADAQSTVDSQTATLKRPAIAVHVVDWAAQSAAHPGWMGPDGIHPTAAGSKGIATLISRALPAAPIVTVVATTSAQGRAAGPVKPGTYHYTQAQMQTAVAKYDPQQAVALGAIAMAETTGWDFPTWNAVAGGHWYHGPWAFQDATLAGLHLNANQLDGSLDYAAQAAAKLASTGITHGKWETWPAMAAKYMGGGVGSGSAAAVPVANVAPAGAPSNCPAAAVPFTGSNVKGPGGSLSGQWAPGVQPIVEMLSKRFHITAGTYTNHHPDGGHAADFAYMQFGVDSGDGAPGVPGKGPQWQIAQWIAENLVDKGLAWYVGHHASIHSHGDPPGVWRVIGSQASMTDPTQDHLDHVHVSWPPWFGNAGGSSASSFPPANNFSSPAVWAVPPLPAKF